MSNYALSIGQSSRVLATIGEFCDQSSMALPILTEAFPVAPAWALFDLKASGPPREGFALSERAAAIDQLTRALYRKKNQHEYQHTDPKGRLTESSTRPSWGWSAMFFPFDAATSWVGWEQFGGCKVEISGGRFPIESEPDGAVQVGSTLHVSFGPQDAPPEGHPDAKHFRTTQFRCSAVAQALTELTRGWGSRRGWLGPVYPPGHGLILKGTGMTTYIGWMNVFHDIPYALVKDDARFQAIPSGGSMSITTEGPFDDAQSGHLESARQIKQTVLSALSRLEQSSH